MSNGENRQFQAISKFKILQLTSKVKTQYDININVNKIGNIFLKDPLPLNCN